MKKRRLGYVNRKLCSECGGTCCMRMPGSSMPEDFGAPDTVVMVRKIAAALRSGDWSIDWWEGDPRDGSNELDEAYFVRPATLEHRGRVRDASWGGRCVFHDQSGCTIFDNRPSGCRGLRPSATAAGEHCKTMHSDKRGAAIAWIPYLGALLDAECEV